MADDLSHISTAQRPGGYYLSADGTAHDAHGNPVDVIAEPIADAPKPKKSDAKKGAE
jgi:hypothetical protein